MSYAYAINRIRTLEKVLWGYLTGGIILIIVIRLRLYTKQVPLKVHIAFEGVINTIYMTNKY